MSVASFNKLPLSGDSQLSTSSLSSIFNNTSASYKFYWLLSILDTLEQNSTEITFKDLNIRMIALSWHTINFHKLSFGLQDKLEASIRAIIDKSKGQIKENESKQKVVEYLTSNYIEFKKDIDHFNFKVPYHFLSPFLGSLNSKKEWISKSSESYVSNKPCLYKLTNDSIIIHSSWKKYLINNRRIIQDFVLWNFTHKFLESRNPNVPNITRKLTQKPKRKSLSKQMKLWLEYSMHKKILSIYTGKSVEQFDLDHFIPWSFVTHDQIWNLVPIEKSLNSSKSNKLPSQKLIESFSEQQFDFVQCLKTTATFTNNKKLFEDYSYIFKEPTKDILTKEKLEFVQTITNHLNPLIQFANNLGFQSWNYEKQPISKSEY